MTVSAKVALQGEGRSDLAGEQIHHGDADYRHHFVLVGVHPLSCDLAGERNAYSRPSLSASENGKRPDALLPTCRGMQVEVKYSCLVIVLLEISERRPGARGQFGAAVRRETTF